MWAVIERGHAVGADRLLIMAVLVVVLTAAIAWARSR